MERSSSDSIKNGTWNVYMIELADKATERHKDVIEAKAKDLLKWLKIMRQRKGKRKR
jgi:hypothetical protein